MELYLLPAFDFTSFTQTDFTYIRLKRYC